MLAYIYGKIFIKPLGVQWGEIYEYSQQIWFDIALFMSIEVLYFKAELHTTWNVIYYA